MIPVRTREPTPVHHAVISEGRETDMAFSMDRTRVDDFRICPSSASDAGFSGETLLRRLDGILKPNSPVRHRQDITREGEEAFRSVVVSACLPDLSFGQPFIQALREAAAFFRLAGNPGGCDRRDPSNFPTDLNSERHR